jgi:hypothetical protein
MEPEMIEAVKNVVERVSSYQESAPEGQVEKELRGGLDEAGISLDDAQVTALAEAIEADPAGVDVASVLA